MKQPKQNPLFVIAADNWKNQVMSLHKEGSSKNTARIVGHLIDEFGHRHVQSITKEHIQKYIVYLANKGKMQQIKRSLSVFKGIMEYADDDWDMPTRLKLPKFKKPKQPFYTFDEVREILKHAIGTEKVLIMTLAETGCRLGEALGLQTADVRNGKISITKNVYEGVLQNSPKTDSSVREVSISGRLEAALASQSFKDNPKMFIFRSPSEFRPYWPVSFGQKLKSICSNAGVEYKGSHAFRRGNITELLTELEIPERIVGARVGHLSTGTTLGVYCKVKDGSDQKWVEKIEKWLYEGEL
jgi:integrase